VEPLLTRSVIGPIQVENYCHQLNHLSAQTLEKLHLLESLQKARITA
jgi:hypothetical protein